MHKPDKAVAIRYDESLPAPFLLAKGKGHLAKKILKLAEEYDIPVQCKGDLAESLFTLDIGEMIPEDLYEIMAILLSHVYGIQERK